MSEQKDVEAIPQTGGQPAAGPTAYRVEHIHKRRMGLIPLLAVIVVAAVAAFLFFSGRIGGVSSRTVQFGLRNVGEMATQTGFFTSVGTIKDSRTLFGISIPFTQRQCVYSYDGVVKAGVDFADISVSIDRIKKEITVTMPAVRIFDIYVDDESLVVYMETRNVVNPIKLDVLSESRVKMKEEVKKTALSNGILENARKNAEVLVSGFIQGMFTDENYAITFVWPEEKGGANS
ncbi:MAG: DUF4230 domain-containing protein [Clostridia bacterium]|nr:DUF4230 domain-containing protein [Clostridia bacterium]